MTSGPCPRAGSERDRFSEENPSVVEGSREMKFEPEPMEHLIESECWTLLRAAQVGRLAVAMQSGGSTSAAPVTGRRFMIDPRDHCDRSATT